jgi:hypothetical protein
MRNLKNQNLSLSDREWTCPGAKASTAETKTPLGIWKTRVEDNSSLWGILETQNACGQRVRPTMVGNTG